MPRAVVFDFDGVILQSVDIKTRAFETLFATEDPDAVDRILAYHRANGGISRYEKFRYAYREVLRRPLPAEEEKALGKRFNALVEEAVSVCPFVPGAEEFLKKNRADFPLYVASGTPENELRRIVERRGLAGYFKAAYGAPSAKEKILLDIARQVGCQPDELLMVGDSINDYHAARAVGAVFLGVATPGEKSPFPDDATVLPDLTGLKAALASA